MSKPARPDLDFATFDALLADAGQLRDTPYEKTGAWSLGMILDHIAKSVASPFNPDATTLPAPLRPPARFLIHRMVKTRRYPTWVRFPAPKALRPTSDIDPHAAYAELESAIAKVNATPGDTIEGPPLGTMTRADFVGQQLVHAAHHLSFLKSKA